MIWRVLPILTAAAILALLLQQQEASLAGPPDSVLPAAATIKAAPSHPAKLEPFYLRAWRSERPTIERFFLENDRKQNLLVWPNVSEGLTRSPPAFPSHELF